MTEGMEGCGCGSSEEHKKADTAKMDNERKMSEQEGSKKDTGEERGAERIDEGVKEREPSTR
jgi:hypothetical protein